MLIFIAFSTQVPTPIACFLIFKKLHQNHSSEITRANAFGGVGLTKIFVLIGFSPLADSPFSFESNPKAGTRIIRVSDAFTTLPTSYFSSRPLHRTRRILDLRTQLQLLFQRDSQLNHLKKLPKSFRSLKPYPASLIPLLKGALVDEQLLGNLRIYGSKRLWLF